MPNRLIILDDKRQRRWGSGWRTAHYAGRMDLMRIEMEQARKDDIWISSSELFLNRFVRAMDWPPRHKMGSLLIHTDLRPSLLNCLSVRFQRVVLISNAGVMVQPDELAEILQAGNKAELIIGADIDKASGVLTLWRGDFSKLVVPLSAFKTGGTGIAPDFNDVHITDWGQTLKFGQYESSVDSVLYEYDPDYRRQLNKKRRREEKTLGASLRRLRLQRGMRREDFAPLSPKTIARIERGEVKSVRDQTLRKIASRLGVSADEIETY